MTHTKELHQVKTIAEFESGYWYASDLKRFARDIGVKNASRLRKDQLEHIIKNYIDSGCVLGDSKPANASKKTRVDQLSLNQKIQHYVSNKQTKSFIMAEALKMCPELPKKSGVWYWINRWREEQLAQNNSITYRDLIQHFVKLSAQEGRLPQIPSARFNNFITDFLSASEGTRDQAKTAWEELKLLDIPNTYAAWKSRQGIKK